MLLREDAVQLFVNIVCTSPNILCTSHIANSCIAVHRKRTQHTVQRLLVALTNRVDTCLAWTRLLCVCTGMQDVDQRLTKDVDRLCTDLAELIPTMVTPLPSVQPLTVVFLVCLSGLDDRFSHESCA